MRVELFGYYLYPMFFVLVIGIPVLIVVIVLLLRRLRERRQAYSSSIITTWEKKYIPRLLSKEIRALQENEEELSDEEKLKLRVLKRTHRYIRECEYWNSDELLSINSNSIKFLTEIIFSDIKENHKEEPDRAVLLIHAIDNINGGIDYEMGKHYMSDDMDELQNHEKMGDDEAKVLSFCVHCIERSIDEYVDLDSNVIPTITLAIPELVGITREDFASAIRDIESCIDFTQLKKSTFRISTSSIIDLLDNIVSNQTKSVYDQIYLSYFRALACTIDRQLYDDILRTIED